MGWAKQSGDAWVLQRTMHTEGDNLSAKSLQLSVIGLLSIEDAKFLVTALEREIEAARLAERDPQVTFAVVYSCRKCGGRIEGNQGRFGSATTGWEHMEGECLEME